MIAPRRRAPDHGRRPAWGVFLPLYALPPERPGGGLRRPARAWCCDGRRSAAASSARRRSRRVPRRDPFEPSPYAPASRLFWNELYVDLARAARARALAPAARAALGAGCAGAPADGLVDYARPRRGGAPRCVLAGAGRAAYGSTAFAARGARGATPTARTPRARATDAACPRRPRDGRRATRPRRRYTCTRSGSPSEQLARGRAGRRRGRLRPLPRPAARRAPRRRTTSWREPRALRDRRIGVGAPPDVLVPRGPELGLPAAPPERHRASAATATPIACLRTAFRHAGALRIDHVDGLAPPVLGARGLRRRRGRVRRAIRPTSCTPSCCLESHRRGALVVGEDLGTVPPAVRETLDRHGIVRSYVLQFELGPDDDGPAPDPAAARALGRASTPTTRRRSPRWWRHGARRPQAAAARRRSAPRSAELGAGPARCSCSLSLEDLWGETRPQNVPGTTGGDELAAPRPLTTSRALERAARPSTPPSARSRRPRP